MKKPKRILVGLKTRQHAVELTDMACRTGARGASLLLVHVLEIAPAMPIDAEVPEMEAEARRILQAGARVARRSRMKVESLLLHARSAGEALVGELKEKKMDLAVMGYHHKRSLEELLLGTTAQHVMKHTPCRLLMSIPPR